MQLRQASVCAGWQQQQQQQCSQSVLFPRQHQQQRCVIRHSTLLKAPLSVARSQQQLCRAQLIPVAEAASVTAAAARAGSPTTTTTAADPCLDISGTKGKAVGSLLAAMCGNALGAQVEPEKHYRLSRMFPEGPQDMSWSFDISSSPLTAGHVTGDYAIMTAVGQSVARCKAADALDMSDAMAAAYDASAPEQWYSPYNKLVLEGLAAGSNPFLLARHAEGYLASTSSRASNTASHRPGRQLHGMSDFSALSRVIPVAIAYREAPLQELRKAAEAAVLLTHPSDTAADAAVVLAAAIAWCMRSDPSSTNPSQLLDHLQADVAATDDMKSKLALLQGSLPALEGLGSIDNWIQFWRSKAWNDITGVANLLTKQNLAIEATQAAALALWVVAVSWQHPQQAVMLAASLGGYAATTGTLVGSLAGALHGCEWVPQAWWDNLQDELKAAEGQHSSTQQQHEQQEEAEAAGGSDQAAAAAAKSAQSGQAEAQKSGMPAGSAAAVGGDSEGDVSEWMLRPVSKYSVVVLGHQLADLDCKQAAPLL